MARTAVATKKPTTANAADWHVYSTITSSQTYCRWNNNRDVPTVEQSVFIAGGAGVMQKRALITSYGTKTDITDAEYDFLKTVKLFNQHVEGGWLKVVKAISRQEDMNLMVSDMQARDGSAQLVPSDFEAMPENERPIVKGIHSDGTPVTNKPRTRPYTFGVGSMSSFR